MLNFLSYKYEECYNEYLRNNTSFLWNQIVYKIFETMMMQDRKSNLGFELEYPSLNKVDILFEQFMRNVIHFMFLDILGEEYVLKKVKYDDEAEGKYFNTHEKIKCKLGQIPNVEQIQELVKNLIEIKEKQPTIENFNQFEYDDYSNSISDTSTNCSEMTEEDFIHTREEIIDIFKMKKL